METVHRMASAATSSPSTASFRGGVRCWRPARVAVYAPTTTVSSPEAATPLKADLAPAALVPLMRVAPDSLQGERGSLLGVLSRGDGEQDRVADLNGPGAMEYLTGVLASSFKVYDVAFETPPERAGNLSESFGVNLHIKREDPQPVFSFKLGGAYNMMSKLSQEQLNNGVICVSAGNHAQGVAISARRLGCDAIIVMPVTTPEIKWRSVERLGATVVLRDSYDEAQSYAKLLCDEEGRTFIPPFDHPDIIVGHRTVGMEIVHQLHGPLNEIFVPVGGGGLIAAIPASVRLVRPEDMFEDRNILEPAGALALAGVESYCKYYGLKGETVVAISSGANMNCGCKAEPGEVKLVAVGAYGKQCDDCCRCCCRDGEKPLAWLNAYVDTTTGIIKLMVAGLSLYVIAHHPLLVTRWEAWLLALVRFILVSGLGATLALCILLMYAGIRMSFKWGSPSGSA